MSTRALTRFFFGAALVTATLWPVPGAAQNREHQQLFADLRMLQEQTQQLRLAIAS